MKQYPSIEGPSGAPNAHCIAFVKYDGSNLRWEWTRKRGFHKFGTRQRLFDQTDPQFGAAIPLFMDTLGPVLDKFFRKNKPFQNNERITIYTEYFGPKSFAGQHDLEPNNEPMELRLLDVWLHKYGFIGPREFVKTFGHFPFAAEVVYEGKLNASFIESVRNGEYDVVEGVICKGGSGGHRDLWMRKIKTIAYLERLKEVFGTGWTKFGE